MIKNTFLLTSIADTAKLATIIANIAEPNLIILLDGPLGSGKTQLTKLIGHQLGISTVINSPTFNIYHIYRTKKQWQLVHIDAYRLLASNDNEEYYELFDNNFTIIEWPAKLNINFTNYRYLHITCTIINDTTRKVTITSHNLPPATCKYWQEHCHILTNK